jgi:hypothetical protein
MADTLHIGANLVSNIKLGTTQVQKVMLGNTQIWANMQLLPLQPFIAPANFDASAQNVNIHQIFSFYDNPNKAYGYTFSDSYNTLTLAALGGVTYRYGYTRGGIDYVFDVASVTNPFTASTDTKRWVIVNNTVTGVNGTLPIGAVWGYLGNKCNSIYADGANTLKYVHCQELSFNVPSNSLRNTSITGYLAIPSNAITINSNAFQGCTSITGVGIPNSVTSIGSSAFQGCTSITGVGIPNSVTYIGDSVFENCSLLTLISNLISVSYLGKSAFRRCYALTSVDLHNSTFTALAGTFCHCSSLFSVILPNTLQTLTHGGIESTDWGCFGDCQFTSISLPSSLTYIGGYSFSNCNKLTSINIPNSVTIIRTGAFYNASAMTSVIIPRSVTYIGDSAFENCSNTALMLPSNGLALIYIGNSAFRRCYFITEVNLADSTFTSLNGTFCHCSRLSSISLPNTLQTITYGGSANNGDQGCFVDCQFTTITIPASVTFIGDYSFSNCNKLTSINIPNAVNTIGPGCFQSCSNILVYNFYTATAPTISGTPFSNYAKPLHVKVGASGYNVAPWTNTAIFSSIIADL